MNGFILALALPLGAFLILEVERWKLLVDADGGF